MAKMTPKKRQNLRRIRRFIKSAEQRGYKFAEELKQNLSTFTTQKLKSLTPKKLYKQATYKIGGETVSGEKGRKIERTIAAKKAVETKIRKREEREQREWERIHRDYIENISLSDYQDEEQYIPHFTDIVLSNVEQMIEDAKAQERVVGAKRGNILWTSRNNADLLSQYLAQEISSYGRDKVAIACEQAPDEIKARAQLALGTSNEEDCRDHCVEIVAIIKSYIPTIDESKEFTADA